MISRFCARLLLAAGIAGLAQMKVGAQALLDGAQTQFGTEPAPYAQQSQQMDAPRAVPVGQPGSGNDAYGAPGGYNSNGYGQQPQQQQDMGSLGAPDPAKPLGRGDILTFSIAQDREPPTIMRVTDTGELDFSIFPKIGRISVAGRTCADVAAELKRKLEADYYNQADVTLGINQINHLDSVGTVYVSGNVRMPGPQHLPSGERTTVASVIISAGGLDKFGNGHRVQVTRKDKDGKTVKFNVDVDAIIIGGRREKDVEVMDGDYINVPQKLINF